MNLWTIIFLITTILGFIGLGICLKLLQRMYFEQIRMENYLIKVGTVMSDFYQRIDKLFSQSIHYYDDTIYEFIDNTKNVKKDIDDIFDEYDDLREYIVPELSPEEKVQQQQVEILGLIKPSIPIRRV
jgi:hypothetical protein